MKLKTLYLILCILGIVLPYWQFLPWGAQNGLHMPLFFHELFANRVSAFFGMDVLVSAAVLVVFMRTASSHSRPLVTGAGPATGRRIARSAAISLPARTQARAGAVPAVRCHAAPPLRQLPSILTGNQVWKNFAQSFKLEDVVDRIQIIRSTMDTQKCKHRIKYSEGFRATDSFGLKMSTNFRKLVDVSPR
jgi:hypothetical protein